MIGFVLLDLFVFAEEKVDVFFIPSVAGTIPTVKHLLSSSLSSNRRVITRSGPVEDLCLVVEVAIVE